MAGVALIVFLGGPAAAAPARVEGVPSFGHVFLLVGENKEITRIDAVNAPYITDTLKPQSAWLTNYYALTHFSEANYVGMTSGQYTHCEQFDGSVASCHQNVDNIFNQLGSGSWQVWAESMPSPCYASSAGTDKNLNHYAPKHNPALFFDDLATDCPTYDLPAGTTGPNDMTTFNAALQSGSVARFNFVVPNICEDGHDNCKPQGNEVKQFDDFVAREVPLIEASPAFGSDGVIIVTFDEGNSNLGPGTGQFAGGGNVVFAVLSPLAKPAVYGGTFNHYSLLRTLEDGFGITNYLGGAATASPINTIWQP
jgi:hypothetical protein